MGDRPVAAVLGLAASGPGGTLAAALRSSGLFESVVAWDPGFDTARGAQKRGVADRYVNSAADAARMAAIVFLALRGEAFTEALTAIGPNLKPGAVACNVYEAHETAAAVAARLLPGNVSFLSADPVAWEDADGFRQGVLCISPLPSAHADAVGFVAQVGEKLGMEPFFVDAREHDALAAGLQTFPDLLAAVQLHVATAQPSWREMSRLAGKPFRVATAPVDGDSAAGQAALASGRDHLVRWLDQVIAELTSLREGLQDGREPADYFEKAALARARWLAERQLPGGAAELPRTEPLPKRRFPF
jgi:prephenate dehydrogenase